MATILETFKEAFETKGEFDFANISTHPVISDSQKRMRQIINSAIGAKFEMNADTFLDLELTELPRELQGYFKSEIYSIALIFEDKVEDSFGVEPIDFPMERDNVRTLENKTVTKAANDDDYDEQYADFDDDDFDDEDDEEEEDFDPSDL